MSARHFDYLPREHIGLLTGQEQDSVGNIFRLNQFAHGDDRDNLLLKIGIYPAGLSRAGGNTVHADAILRHFEGDAAGERLKGCFAGTVGNLTGKDLSRNTTFVPSRARAKAVVAPIPCGLFAPVIRATLSFNP